VHLTDLSNASEVLMTALEDLDLIRFSRNDPRLDVAIHRSIDESGRLIVFVANPTGKSIQAEIGLDTDLKSVREIWEDRNVQTDGKTLSEPLPAYTIRIYECTL
jgi:beta-galactosidase